MIEWPWSFASYHLFRNHHHCFGRELSVAVVKQIFERGSEEVNDKNIMEPFLSEVIDIWDPSW